LGLLLYRAEHSVGRACARARRGGCRDEPVRAAEVRVLRRADEPLRALNAWDASGGVRQDAAAGAAHPHHRDRLDADVGKLAGREQDVRAQGAFLPQPERWFVQPEEAQAAAAALCKPDAVQSAAQSCAARAAAEAQAEPDVAAQPSG